MLLRTSAALLVLWGLTFAVGEMIGAWMIQAPWLGALYLAFAGLVVVGGLGLWRRRAWGMTVAAVGLLAPIVVDFLRAVQQRDGEGIRLTSHAMHLLVSGCLWTAAWLGMRRSEARRPVARPLR